MQISAALRSLHLLFSFILFVWQVCYSHFKSIKRSLKKKTKQTLPLVHPAQCPASKCTLCVWWCWCVFQDIKKQKTAIRRSMFLPRLNLCGFCGCVCFPLTIQFHTFISRTSGIYIQISTDSGCDGRAMEKNPTTTTKHLWSSVIFVLDQDYPCYCNKENQSSLECLFPFVTVIMV